MFRELLAHLAQLRDEKKLWIPLPGEVDRWWRQRAKMTIVEDQYGVRVEGEGSERAHVAYASEKDGKLAFELETTPDLQLVPPKRYPMNYQSHRSHVDKRSFK